MPGLRVLLVEDEPADVRLIEEVLKEVALTVDLRRASTGDEALASLRASGGTGAADGRPDVVLLDLNLPGMDGRQLLARIRADPALSSLPVVVITSSPADADVLTAFDLRAQGYLRKPVSGQELATVLARAANAAPEPPVSPASRRPG